MNTSGESKLFHKQCFLCSKPLQTNWLHKKCSKAHLENYEKYVQKHEVYKHIFNVNSLEYGSYEGQVFSTCPSCCDGVDKLLLLNNQMEELEITLGCLIESLTTEILQNRMKYSDPLAIEPEPEDNNMPSHKTEVILSDIADVVEIKQDLLEINDEGEDDDFKDFTLDFHSPSPQESWAMETESISENNFPALNHNSHVNDDASKTGSSSKDNIYPQIALREIRIVLERIKMPYSNLNNAKNLSMKKSSELVDDLAGDYSDWSNDDVPFEDDNNSDADSRMRPQRKQRKCKTKYQTPPVKRAQRVDYSKLLYNCEICGDEMKPMKRNAFRKHIILHPKYKPFGCKFPNCEMKFRWSYALTRHENEHLGKENNYECEICGNSYKGPYELRKHKQRVHVEADQVCKICGNKYKLIQNLMVHVKKFHGMTHLEYADRSDMTVTPFCCEICQQYYSTENMLDSHNKRFHSDENVDFFCEFCEETVTPVRSLTYINTGNIKLHTIGKIIKCLNKSCEDRFFNCTEMYRDHKKNHKRKERKKYESRKVFKSTITIGKRRKVTFNYAENDNLSPVSNSDGDGDNDDSKQYECKKCEKVFAKMSNLKKHVKLHKKIKMSQKDQGKCEICDKTYTMKNLPRHIRMVHNKKPKILVKCPVCEKDFKSPSHLLRHSKTHLKKKQLADEVKLQLRTCKVCGQEFKNVKRMNCHFRNSHLKNLSEEDKKVLCPFTCEICGMLMTTAEQLNCHVRVKHPESRMSTKEFICEKCGKGFSKEKSLQRHIELHKRKMKELKCDICEKVFNFRSNLKKHIQAHANPIILPTPEELLRRRSCPICGKVFNRRSYVRPHMQTHRDNKLSVEDRATYMCHQCGKSLTSSKNLNRHILNVHRDDKPFKCTQPGCDKEYKDENNLRKHVQCHLVEANYECSICGKKFKRKDYMQIHFRRNHDPQSKQYLKKKTLNEITDIEQLP